MSLTPNSSAGGTAPVISGDVASLSITGNAPVSPFAHVVLTDINAGATDTLTITLSGAAGVLADGAGFSGLQGSGTSYTLTGTASAITKELDALVFTPATVQPDSSGTTTFTLADSSTGYTALQYNQAATTLGSFNGYFGPGSASNGQTPYAGLVADAAGNLFGTTIFGGANGGGAVYELTKTTNGYNAPVAIADLSQATGINPESQLAIDSKGNIYGTTSYGGTFNDGTVFELVKGAGGYGAPVVLANFNGTNGANPGAGVVFDAAGNLFGTTVNGGPQGGGTVFEMVRNGNGFGAPINLTSTASAATGFNPGGSLYIDSAGNLFGTAANGGAYGFGTISEIKKTATGYAAPIALVSFNGTNGANPAANLIADASGNLFGTTGQGGANGKGTVFELVKTATGYAAPTTLASFDGVSAAGPNGGLVMDSAGDLFGTTTQTQIDGTNGTVFELKKTAGGYGPLTILTTFSGSVPSGSLLIDASGILYGVTQRGGQSFGTVFELGTGVRPVVITAPTTTVVNTVPAAAPTLTGVVATQATFTGIPFNPFSTAVFTDPNFGAIDTLTVTVTGGAGTVHDNVFNGAQLVANGNGTYTATGNPGDIEQLLTNLYFVAAAGTPTQSVATTFTVKLQSSAFPGSVIKATTSVSAKTPAVAPTITGLAATTAAKNGAAATPFAGVTIGDGNPGATETVTIEFGGAAGMLRDGAGYSGLQKVTAQHYTLTGSAAAVTAELDALVFTPAAGATGTTTFTLANTSSAYGATVYAAGVSFVATIPVNSYTAPAGDLISDAAGNLYGETRQNSSYSLDGGTVYEQPKTATGYGTAIVLGQFTLPTTRGGPSANGTSPTGGLVMDTAGDLFGMTTLGGKYGAGAVFEIAHTASGYGPIQVLSSFKLDSDGSIPGPTGPLVIDSAGNLFGTTLNGGTANAGVVFELAKTAAGYAGIKYIANFGGGQKGLNPAPNGLFIDPSGNMFVVTQYGGAGQGNIMELVKTATGFTKPKLVYSFTGALGTNPFCGLVASPRGDLYGTTSGNASGNSYFGPTAPSTIYELGKTKLGYSKTPVLIADLTATLGATARSEVAFNPAGDIFGLAQAGNTGAFLVYELVRTVSGYSAPVVLGSYNSGFDALFGNLTVDAQGNVFGTDAGVGGYLGAHLFELVSGNLVTTVTNSVTTAAAALVAAGDTAGHAFAIAGTPGTQVINGFVADGSSHDILGISTSLFADWAHLLGATKQQGSDLVITLAPGEQVRLTNVALASFTRADVHFT